MKFLLKVVLIVGLSYISALILPWWIVVVCAFLLNALIGSGALNSFLSGFLGIGLLWMIAAWIIFSGSEGDLVARLAPQFKANEGVVLVVYTAILGALVGGLGGLSGCYFRRLFIHDNTSAKYY